MTNVTPHQAKTIIAAKLAELNLPPHRLSARTVSFMDLLRTTCIFVTVRDSTPNQLWNNLQTEATKHGFRIQAGN